LFLQVNDKGVHWEQSPLYQYESLYYLLTVLHHAQLTEYSMEKWFINRVKTLVKNSIHQLQPDGKLLPQSDTDQVEVGYITRYAEVLLNDNFIPFSSRHKGCLMLLWLVGWDPFDIYMSGQQKEYVHNQTDEFDMVTGNSWVRNNWTQEADFLSVHCGPIGSGHGHLDLGHFNFSYHGIPVFVDSGRFSYVDNPIRTYLKSVHAHNTILLDGQGFSDVAGSWKYGKTAEPVAFNLVSKGNNSVTECVYSAKLHDGSFYIVRRRFIFIKELSSVMISDFIMVKGSHTCDVCSTLILVSHYNKRAI
jgi:hypothetical protein